MYKTSTTCRACNSTDLVQVFDLGNQPLANDHCLPDAPRQGFYPLAIKVCQQCHLAQLSAVVDKRTLYENYTYVTSSSHTMLRHFERLFQDIESEHPEKRIVEIGSNNGDLLLFARNRGYEVLGIDPAKNLAAMASAKAIPTIADFLNMASALKADEARPAVILARHCFAHVDDWREFMESLTVMARKETLICIEIPYVKDLLQNVEFDTVYHEHLSYVSIAPIKRLLAATPFHIHRVIRYGIHGGALLLMLRHADSIVQRHLSAEEFDFEENIGMESWVNFATAAREKINAVRDLVLQMRSQGKIVSAFGASAKCTVLLNACGFTKEHIAFVSDNSPLKPGRLIPGTDIPIIEEGQMLSEHPDFSIMSAWNFRKEICAKMEKWRLRGGKFIVPSRVVEII